MPGSQLVSTPAVSLLLNKQQRITALLAVSNPQQRLGKLVDTARHRPPLPDELRTDANRVQGCLVRTWFVSELRDGVCRFQCDSDAVMIKACLGLLCDVYSGHTPEEIAADAGDLLVKAGILPLLAENRQRTLHHVSAQLRDFATANLASRSPALIHTHDVAEIFNHGLHG